MLKIPAALADVSILADSPARDAVCQRKNIFSLYFHLMSLKQKITGRGGIYFIAITCFKWLPLFTIADSYPAVYKWFNYLKQTNHYTTGYVIMPII